MNINNYFQAACEQRASDLHLVVDRPPMLRINGQMEQVVGEPVITRAEMERMLMSILSPAQKKKFTDERELDFSYEMDAGFRFRVNLLYEKDNMALVARVISSKIPNMEEIGMPQVAYNLARSRQGLILITGPTGSGKSTTLAAMINLINHERTANIVTLEDPIEFLFNSEKSIILQRQLGTDMLSFGAALKHVVRQDPDVIMVGEMRDLETISATITLAETGHLVLATLHTYNAAQTVDRIVDVFPPFQQNQVRIQLSNSLLAVISQQLIPQSNNEGRVAAREVMVNTPAIANIIRDNKIPQIKTVIQTSADDGMNTLEQDIERLVASGSVDKKTAEYYLKTILRKS